MAAGGDDGRQALAGAREELDGARQERVERIAALARRRAEHQRARQAYGPQDERTRHAERQLDEAVGALRAARHREGAARTGLHERLEAYLPEDPEDLVASLDAGHPVVMLPVRLETRYARGGQDTYGELRVRIYPDAIAAYLHEPLLSGEEADAGRAYWERAWREGSERDAWSALVARFGPTRAAWIVLRMEPTNLDDFPDEPATDGQEAGQPGPAIQPVETRPEGWRHPPEARALPDRWLVLIYREGAERHRILSRPVREPLVLTMGLSTDAPEPGLEDTIDLSGDGLLVDQEILWAFDFDRAEEIGMAVRIPLSEGDFHGGLDRILVLGVKASVTPQEGAKRLADLLESHHYTRGLAFVPQGTPTNNTSSTTSGYPPPDPGGERSFALERGQPLAAVGTDGARFMAALGLPPSLADHLEGADRNEQRTARALAEALWPATIGYYMEQLMSPVFTTDDVAAARRYFVDHVRGRGHYPAFRVGEVPYALLAVSALDTWQALRGAPGPDAHMAPALRTLRNIWLQAVPEVPRIGRTDDPDSDLLATLGTDASTREVRVRAALGLEAQWNLLGFLGMPFGSWLDAERSVARAVLEAVGRPDWDPRVAWMSYADVAYPFKHALVTEQPLSETAGLEFDYVRWIRTATIAQLRAEALPAGLARPRALLYLMLRHAMLAEYARLGAQLLLQRNLVPIEELREPELVKVAPGTHSRRTVWEHLDRQVAGLTGTATLGEFIARPRTVGAIPQDADLASYHAALATLEGLPTAELERVFTETLDVASHRLDAWINALPAKRLEQLRTERPQGVHLGAYGWVEDLLPDPPERRHDRRLPGGRTVPELAGSAGYVYTPSMAHGAAAAVLRNAHATRSGEERKRYSVDLSSARVRTALYLLDAVREGQPLGAVLGYRFERGLHEGHPGRELDKFIDDFRNLYPVVANKAEDSGQPAEQVAARNVVDGLALRRAWEKGEIRWGSDGLTPDPAERTAIEAELRALDDAVDALADLLAAESVFQLVRGNMDAAGATLDAMAKGARPPDPEIARTPRGGTSLYHRVALVLGGEPVPGGAWGTPLRTPRARAEPHLNAWAGQLLGEPATVKCQASFPDPADPAVTATREVTVDELGLEPLDILALGRTVDATPLDSELDRRVAYVAAAGADEGASVTIEYTVTGLAPGERTFPELLEVAHAINALLGVARPLRARDLLPPERETDAATADPLTAELSARVERTLEDLADAISGLVGALHDIRTAPSGTDPDLDPLRDALRAASLFGATSAFPTTRKGTAQTLRAAMVRQAERVLDDLERRRDAAESATDAVDKLTACFGRDLAILPRFKPGRHEDLAQALAHPPSLGDPDADEVGRWFARASRVRPPLGPWRRLGLYAGTTGASLASFDIVELPHRDGAPWVGLPFGTPERRPPQGVVSLALHRAVAPAADEPWTGLLLDEWTEVIPSVEEDPGIVFHYDAPNAEAPQAVLVAVPPAPAATWTLDALVRTLNETLDLAKIRAVDGELLGLLGQLLPMTFLASNADDDTVSTRFADLLVEEPRIVAVSPEGRG